MSIIRYSDEWPAEELKESRCKTELTIGTIGSLYALCFGFGVAFCGILFLMGNGDPDEVDGMDYMMIGGMIVALIGSFTLPVYLSFSRFRKRICKALAGLRTGTYQTASDLCINLDMSKKVANMIIDGKYDCLLDEEDVQKYL